jgi:hypothetical protein
MLELGEVAIEFIEVGKPFLAETRLVLLGQSRYGLPEQPMVQGLTKQAAR